MNSDDTRFFESMYRRFNKPRFIHPDPLEVVRTYERVEDREIAALVCAGLALGRVAGIIAACTEALRAIPSPRRDLTSLGTSRLSRRLRGFVYRFFRGDDIAELYAAIGAVIETYGSLEACFAHGGLSHMVTTLRQSAGRFPEILLPVPERGSACKRLHLFLRWMVRCDEVDPGGWATVPAADLRVPVDTHMLKVARHLGITGRKTADSKTVEEVTGYFKRLRPDDPVRYDFVLTRSGISDSRVIHRAVYGADFRVRPA